jgi:hypothetical protein
MRKMTIPVVVISLLCLGGSLRSEQPLPAPQNSGKTPFRPYATVAQVMNSIIDPAADVIWEASGTIVTETGTEQRQPKDEEEWVHVRNNAILLTEAGNLLMISPRARDNGAWMKAATSLMETGEKLVGAADAKEVDKMFALGGELYQKCLDCHQQYIPTMRQVGAQSKR